MSQQIANSLVRSIPFERLFRSSSPSRDKFLSRLFGIFSEEVVRLWARQSSAPYEDLGRPTLRRPGEQRGKTLDFAFRSRQTGHVFIAEMKCELEFENYRYLKLAEHGQLRHHTGDAFQRFLALGQDRSAFDVFVGGTLIRPDGTMLVWGSVDDSQVPAIAKQTGIAAILSVENMVSDLVNWDVAEYREYIESRASWCTEMFRALSGQGTPIKDDAGE